MKTNIIKLLAAALLLTAVCSLFTPAAHAQSAPAPAKVVAGSSVEINVTADGKQPFTYVWQKAPVGSTEFVALAGQTGSKLTITSATAADAVNYRVIVGNDYGTTTSTTASINAGAAPAILSFGVVVTPPPVTP